MDAVRAVSVEGFAGRADTGAGLGIVVEILGPIVPCRLLRVRLVVERIGQRLVFAPILEALVAGAQAVVCREDQNITWHFPIVGAR